MKMNNKFNRFEYYMKEKRKLINAYLDKFLPSEDEMPSVLHKAMRYMVFSGGKRVRPLLLLFTSEMFSGGYTKAIPAACGIELIHTFSLIHDDLPALDNDDLRRGKPTCHKAFSEDVAILAGDALLVEGIRLISYEGLNWALPYEKLVILSDIITKTLGTYGLVGGEMMDLLSERKKISYNELLFIYTHKTADFIRASIEIGAIIGDASEESIRNLSKFGHELGIAFQIKDDILNIEGEEGVMGKPVGSDERQKKATYPLLFGMEKAKRELSERIKKALSYIEIFGDKAWFLRELTLFIRDRSY